eukprot:403367585
MAKQQSYAWEKDISARWKTLKEADISEFYESEQSQKLHKKEAIDKFNQSIKRKSLIRYLTVVIDFSSAAKKQEMRPNRAIVIKSYLSNFVIDYFDQNPLSCLSFVATFRERAIILSDFNDSPQDHIEKICRFSDLEGNASIQNSLELCIENFTAVPSYAKKEILIIFCSITNCDPGNIFETYDKLKSKMITCSVISLSASMFILQKVTQLTGGEFFLSKDQAHFQDLLKRLLVPKESIEDLTQRKQQQNTLIKMGFPMRKILSYPAVCSCHNDLRFLVYICPNCQSPSCELSSFCKVCQIMLVSAAHLSRTAQHNQNLANFQRLTDYLKVETVQNQDTKMISDNNQINDAPLVNGQDVQMRSDYDLSQTNNQETTIISSVGNLIQDHSMNNLDRKSNDQTNGLIQQQYQQPNSQQSFERNLDMSKINEIFPLNSMKTVGSILQKDGHSYYCNGCSKRVEASFDNVDIVICTICKKFYCLDCDIFIHETLLSCPTCQLIQ